MSYLVLARKYRPRAFDEVVGQESVARTLRNAISAGRVAHAYLFAGPRGVGKTSMARILARAMNCGARDAPSPEPCGEDDRCEPCRLILEGDDLDVIEIDGASNRGIDEIRRLRENAKFTPARSRRKIYVVDEVHMLTEPAFNALLKTLEEPPPHVMFVFATTDPQKVPETVRSRCQVFEFRRIRSGDIARRLAQIAEAEGLEAASDLLDSIAESTRGGLRDAVSLLDQLVSLAGDRPPQRSDLEELVGLVPAQAVRELTDRVAEGNAAEAVRAAARIHDVGIEPGELITQLLDHLRQLVLVRVCGPDSDLVEVTERGREVLRRQADALPLERLVYMIRLLASTLRDVRLLGEGRILVEVALIRLARSRDVRALEDLREDLDELVRRLGDAPSPGPVGSPAPERPARPSDLLPGTPADAAEAPAAEAGSLAARWTEVVERVRELKPGVAAFLTLARPVEQGEAKVVLTFGKDAGFHRSQLEIPENRELVVGAIRSVVGRPVSVETLTSEAAEESGAEATSAPRGESVDLASKAREDPMVQRVCDTFGGRVVHVRKDEVREEES